MNFFLYQFENQSSWLVPLWMPDIIYTWSIENHLIKISVVHMVLNFPYLAIILNCIPSLGVGVQSCSAALVLHV